MAIGRATVCAAALALAACVGGGGGGGGGGASMPGGAPGAKCVGDGTEGCWYKGGVGQRVRCEAGVWSDLGACQPGEKCAVSAGTADGPAVAQCVPGGGQAAVDAVSDDGGASGGGDSGDAAIADVQVGDGPQLQDADWRGDVKELPGDQGGDGGGPKCGNGVCEAGETPASCVADCGGANCPGGSGCACVADFECKIGVCHTSGSSKKSCPQECVDTCPTDWTCTEVNNAQANYVSVCVSKSGYVCGDGKCGAKETLDACPKDCKTPAACGNGKCEAGESEASCPADCGPPKPVCGDGTCNGTETVNTCPQDCPPKCGDGYCTAGETAANCAADCPAKCGDGTCSVGESAATCGDDCPAKCGDGFCSPSENANSCPAECAAKCGNLACESGEDAGSCPTDCKPVCGNSKCEAGETATTCPTDCKAASCGDGKCVAPENYQSCASDCIKGTYGCKGMCGLGSKSSTGTACYCDPGCVGGNDCCSDYATYCACAKQCSGKTCGPDGCGSTCGTCGSGTTCDATGVCKPTPKCGDGYCDPGETTTTCPTDCKSTAHPCNSACGSKSPTYGCWCDSGCKGAGDCCTSIGGKSTSCAGSTCASCK